MPEHSNGPSGDPGGRDVTSCRAGVHITVRRWSSTYDAYFVLGPFHITLSTEALADLGVCCQKM